MNGVDLKVSTGNIVDTKADAIVVSVGANFELHGKFDYPRIFKLFEVHVMSAISCLLLLFRSVSKAF